jgi:hypothetical protein
MKGKKEKINIVRVLVISSVGLLILSMSCLITISLS